MSLRREGQNWFEHVFETVDEVLARHRNVPSPAELTTLLEGRPRRNYAKRTHEELLGDVNQLYDKLVSLVRERDDLRKQVVKTQHALDTLNLKFWIVSGLVIAESGMIGFLARELFARIPR